MDGVSRCINRVSLCTVAARSRRRARSVQTLPICMMSIEPREGFDLPGALRGVVQQRRNRGGEMLRRGVALQKLRHHVFAEHQIGEHDGRAAQKYPADRLLEAATRVDHDARHARERELERHRSRYRERRARAAKRAPFVGRLDHDPRPHRPARRVSCSTFAGPRARSATQARVDRSALAAAAPSRRSDRGGAQSRCARLPGSTNSSGGSALRRRARSRSSGRRSAACSASGWPT